MTDRLLSPVVDNNKFSLKIWTGKFKHSEKRQCNENKQ